MSTRKLGVVAALATAAFAIAPAPSHAGVDVGATCDALIGSNTGNIDLSPLVNIGYKTCFAAGTRGS